MVKSRNYIVIWVYCKGFPGREIPLVLLADGRPGYVINQWIFYLLDEEITPSRLELYVRALCHLYDFAMVRYSDQFDVSKVNRLLLADFIDAKKFGTDSYCIKTDDRYSWLLSLGLYWKPLYQRTNTVTLYLKAINQFDEWQVTFHNSLPLSPYEERFLTTWEIYRDFQQRTNWDPFLHLHAAKRHTKRDYETSVYGKYLHKRHENESSRRKTPKAFPLELFFELINKSQNPRDKLLWLLMGAGSLRGSETLHLFLSDAQGIDPQYGDARIILADPEYGYVRWTNENNQEQYTTREEYFQLNWKNEFFSPDHPLCNLQPRTKYGKRNTMLHAGFKGMTFGDNNSMDVICTKSFERRQYDEHHIWWLNARFGEYFWTIFEEYQQEYLWKNHYTGQVNPKGWPWHPWLFVCTNKSNYGMPLTMPAIKQAWKRALKRIGMENSGMGMHSLRHLYGYCCANILKCPLEMTQVIMHHANINSTQTYYGLENSIIRETINEAAIREGRIHTEWMNFP